MVPCGMAIAATADARMKRAHIPPACATAARPLVSGVESNQAAASSNAASEGAKNLCGVCGVAETGEPCPRCWDSLVLPPGPDPNTSLNLQTLLDDLLPHSTPTAIVHFANEVYQPPYTPPAAPHLRSNR
jgi:hypothetical protein